MSLPPSSQVSRSETVLTLTQLTFPNKVYDKHMLIYSDDNFPKYMGGAGLGEELETDKVTPFNSHEN